MDFPQQDTDMDPRSPPDFPTSIRGTHRSIAVHSVMAPFLLKLTSGSSLTYDSSDTSSQSMIIMLSSHSSKINTSSSFPVMLLITTSKPTFHYRIGNEDAERAHAMMKESVSRLFLLPIW